MKWLLNVYILTSEMRDESDAGRTGSVIYIIYINLNDNVYVFVCVFICMNKCQTAIIARAFGRNI